MDHIYTGMLEVKDTERRAAHLSNKLLCMHSNIQSPGPSVCAYGSYSHPPECFTIPFIFAKR